MAITSGVSAVLAKERPAKPYYACSNHALRLFILLSDLKIARLK